MKVLLARKYLSKNPFIRYMQKNIAERWMEYHEDFEKMNEVADKLRENGWSVKIVEVAKVL